VHAVLHFNRWMEPAARHLLAGVSSMWLPVELVLASVDDHVVAAEGVEGASRRPPAAQHVTHSTYCAVS
jgi:hypothetical protein